MNYKLRIEQKGASIEVEVGDFAAYIETYADGDGPDYFRINYLGRGGRKAADASERAEEAGIAVEFADADTAVNGAQDALKWLIGQEQEDLFAHLRALDETRPL